MRAGNDFYFKIYPIKKVGFSAILQVYTTLTISESLTKQSAALRSKQIAIN